MWPRNLEPTGVSQTAPLDLVEEGFPGITMGHGGQVVAADEQDGLIITLVKLHPDGIEQVRKVVREAVREEIAAALKETFQR